TSTSVSDSRSLSMSNSSSTSMSGSVSGPTSTSVSNTHSNVPGSSSVETLPQTNEANNVSGEVGIGLLLGLMLLGMKKKDNSKNDVE
ncbi:LPXTG cell wall anchor domain-containing protein, partial [Lactiplantibacillus plantarum]